MTSSYLSIAGLAAVLLVGTAVETSAKDEAAAIIGGIVAGAAIGAAVSINEKHPAKIYVTENKPAHPWRHGFSPKPGYACYPRQHACYKPSGAYAANLTWNTFGR